MFLLDYINQGDNSAEMHKIIFQIVAVALIVGIVFVIDFVKEIKIQREEKLKQEEEMYEKITVLSDRSSTITPAEFFRIRARAPQSDFTGVYIL